MESYKRNIFLGIILISLGISMTTLIQSGVTSVGTVFIALGGLFFIIGMAKKRQRDG